MYFWMSISMHMIAFYLTCDIINCLSCQFLLASLLVTTILVTVLVAGVVVIRVASITNSWRWIRQRVLFWIKMANSQRKTERKEDKFIVTVPKENKLPVKHNKHDGALAV